MTKKIELQDFSQVAFAIKPILEAHDVPAEFHYSIISDVVFEIANLLDTKTGSSFHESIYALLDEQAEALSEAGPDRIPVTELEIERPTPPASIRGTEHTEQLDRHSHRRS